MKSVLVAAAAASLIAFVSPAGAETYGTLGLSIMDPGGDVRLPSVTARLGWQQSWYGVELEGSAAIGSDHFEGVELRMASQIGVYGVATYATDIGSLFARAGVSKITAKGKFEGESASDSDESFNLGAGGVAYDKSGKNGLRLDFLHQFFSGVDADQVTVSVVRKF